MRSIRTGGLVYAIKSAYLKEEVEWLGPPATRDNEQYSIAGDTQSFHRDFSTVACLLGTWREDTPQQNYSLSSLFILWLGLSKYEVKMENTSGLDFTRTF